MSSEKTPPADVDPELRRGVSRRGFLTDELSRAGLKAVKNLPGIAGAFGFAFKETEAQRDERLTRYLWQLIVGRDPKPEERKASLEVIRNASTPDEKGDALVDVLWALCQTVEFENLNRPDSLLVRGLYKIAMDREPNAEEKQAALDVLAEAPEAGAKGAVLEGLFTGLVRSGESVLRKPLGGR